MAAARIAIARTAIWEGGKPLCPYDRGALEAVSIDYGTEAGGFWFKRRCTVCGRTVRVQVESSQLGVRKPDTEPQAGFGEQLTLSFADQAAKPKKRIRRTVRRGKI